MMKINKMKNFILTTFFLFAFVSIFAQPGTKYDISGKWYAYDVDGNHLINLDIYVFYNDDIEAYYAQYTHFIGAEASQTGGFKRDCLSCDIPNIIREQEEKSKIIFSTDSTFSFTINRLTAYVDNGSIFYTNDEVYELTLRSIPQKNKIVGEAKKTKKYERWGTRTFTDCTDNCGTIDIIYRLQL